MSKPPLEQTIKEYFDQYGAILVGMHQDLQLQQATVDRKLTEAQDRLAASIGAFDQRSGELTAGIAASAESVAATARDEQLAHERRSNGLDAKLQATALSALDQQEVFKKQIECLLDDAEKKVADTIQYFNKRTGEMATKVTASADRLSAAVSDEAGAHDRRLESLNISVEAAMQSAKETVRSLGQDIQDLLARFNGELSAARREFKQSLTDTSKVFADHVSHSRSTLAGEIEKVRGQLREAVARHQRMVAAALDEYSSTNKIQRDWFEAESARLTTLSNQIVARLQTLDEKTAAHFSREASFNLRLRYTVIGIVAFTAVSVLTMVVLWQP